MFSNSIATGRHASAFTHFKIVTYIVAQHNGTKLDQVSIMDLKKLSIWLSLFAEKHEQYNHLMPPPFRNEQKCRISFEVCVCACIVQVHLINEYSLHSKTSNVFKCFTMFLFSMYIRYSKTKTCQANYLLQQIPGVLNSRGTF